MNLLAFLVLAASCREPRDQSHTAQFPEAAHSAPKDLDQVVAPSKVAGAFTEFFCGAEAPGIVCKMKSNAPSADVSLDFLTIKPEFEFILSQSGLPKKEDTSTNGLRKIGFTTSQAASNGGLNIDADATASAEIASFLKVNLLNANTTLGILFKTPQSSEPRFIVRLDRCILVSFLKEWSFNPSSKVAPGLLPIEVQSTFASQEAGSAFGTALESQSRSCFSEDKRTKFELQSLFSNDMLNAANEWFVKSKNSFKN